MSDYTIIDEKFRCILVASDHVKQVAAAKEIGQFLLKTACLETMRYGCDKLAEIYVSVEQRHPVKRSISNVLENLSRIGHNSSVISVLERHLGNSIEKCTTENSNSTLKQTLDNLISCFDCFPAGAQSIANLQIKVWLFTNASLSLLKKQLSFCPSPLETTEIYNLCQQILKVFALFLQEYNTRFYIEQLDESVLSNIYKLILWLLEDELTVLNCRLSSGIALAHLLKVDHGQKLLYVIESGEESVVSRSYVSQMCFCGGLLAGLSDSEISALDENGHSLLVDYIFPQISINAESKEDAGIFFAQCRLLYSWTEKACHILQLPETRLQFDSEKIVHSLLQYVWAVWEHSADGVRYHGKGIFKNAVRIRLLSNSKDGERFLSWLATHLLNMPWHSKGKYSCLSYLVELDGCVKILRRRPSIVGDLVEALTEGSLAPHVTELMDALSQKHKTECCIETWEETWLKPLVNSMSHGPKTQRNSILQYVLPRLLKISPRSINYIVKLLVPENTRNKESSLCTLIMCVKAARACRIKFEKSVLQDGKEMWKNCLPYDMLQLSLYHIDEQVRLDGLGLICDSPKTSEAVSAKEFDILRSFISFNLNVQSPAFRQKSLSHFKKLLLRIRDSAHLLCKKRNDVLTTVDEAVLTDYKSFLSWLIEFLFSSLHPEANFPRRGTVLHLLSLLKEIFGFSYDSGAESNGLSASLQITSYHCQTLLKFLRDTYENNKQVVVGLLRDAPAQHLGLQVRENYEALLDVALSLASSSRPPDSVTAAYLLLLLAKEDAVVTVSLEAFRRNLLICDWPMPSDFAAQNYFCILAILFQRLQSELDVAYESLLEAAANGPMYGILACLRMLLNDEKLHDLMFNKDGEKWSFLLEKIVNLGLQVTETVQPVVCNASPEGHLPMDADMSSVSMLQEAIQKAIGRRFNSATVHSDEDAAAPPLPDGRGTGVDLVKTRAVTAQMLLLCSWRAHKEVSLLLGDVCEKIVLSRSECTRFLSAQQVHQVGDFFIQQLSEIKHRGAFEQAYVGFCKLCKQLWRSTDPMLHRLPRQWLNNLLTSITVAGSDDASCCPTRRSAGIPFIVQALLVTEPDVTNSRCFKEAMEVLLKLSIPETRIYTKTQVHALNILRAIYKNAHLGEEVAPFVAQGVKSAVLGFKSEMWSVRNSATLLFTTLMTRIFGVNRSREDPHKKNCLTGRVFFLRYPDLFEFLLTELQTAATAEQYTLDCDSPCSNLYPILLLLSRLYPSPMEGNDSLLQLGAFIPLVDSCSYSALWWTRQLASRALVPLLTAENQLHYLESLLSRLAFRGSDDDGILPQNIIHGHLLQILNIMKNVPASLKDKLDDDWLNDCRYLLERDNPCVVTKTAFLDVINCALNCNFKISDVLRQTVCNQLAHIDKTLEKEFALEKEQYVTTLARAGLLIALAFDSRSVDETVALLLESEFYEVRCLCLDFLSWLLDAKSEGCDGRSLDHAPLDRRHDWQVQRSERKVRLQSDVLKSNLIAQRLVTMVCGSETHAWCRAELYYVLCAISSAWKKNWELHNGIVLNNTEKLLRIMEELESTNFEDVIVAGLHFSAYLAIAIYEEGQKLGQLKAAAQSALGRWMKCILSSASASCSIPRRSASSKVLCYASDLMVDSAGILKPLNVPLWDAAVILLQDDEPSIRDGICQSGLVMQRSFSCDYSEMSLIPSLCLKMLVQQFVSCFVTSHPDMCVLVLTEWGLRCDSNSLLFESDEQPFDKGEMNVFAEEITLIDIAMNELDRCLRKNDPTKMKSLSIDSFLLLCDNAAALEDFRQCVSLLEVAEKCFTDLKRLVQELLGCCHRTLFLTHNLDTICLKLYQRVRFVQTVSHHDRLRFDVSEVKSLVDRLRSWPYVDSFVKNISDRLLLVVTMPE